MKLRRIIVGSLAVLALFGAVNTVEPTLQAFAATSTATQKITVTFNSEKGSKVASQKINKGSKATKPKAPTRKGYLFVGWYTSSKLTKAFNFNTALKANTTLYAKWAQSVTVSFNSDGGSKVSAKVIKKGTKVTKPTAPKKTNYTFGGWYTSSKLTKAFNFNTLLKANTTLYAKWNKISLSFTGTASDNQKNLLKNQTLTIYDGKTKFATVKTNSNAYFFTHLYQGTTYTFKNSAGTLDVTVKGTGVNKFTLKNVKGSLDDTVTISHSSGATTATSGSVNGALTLQPSSISLDTAKTSYTLSSNQKTLTVPASTNLKVGDALYLKGTAAYPAGLGVVVKSVTSSGGKQTAQLTPVTSPGQVFQNVTEDIENYPVQPSKIELGKDVTYDKNATDSTNNLASAPNNVLTSRSVLNRNLLGDDSSSTTGFSLPGDFKYNFSDHASVEVTDINLALTIKQNITWIVAVPDVHTLVVTPKLNYKVKVNGKLSKDLVNKRFYLTTLDAEWIPNTPLV